MKSSEIVTACKNELPVVLEDGLAWEVVDIAYETYGNEIARYTKKPITLRPLEGQNDGQFKRVGESEIKGLYNSPSNRASTRSQSRSTSIGCTILMIPCAHR